MEIPGWAINRICRPATMSPAAISHCKARPTPRMSRPELAGGYEHEFAHNLTITGRFVYRDLRRIIEDMSGTNVTQALAGVPQIYVVGNPSRALDIFQNVSACSNPGVGNCTSSGYTAFANGTTNPIGADGIPDGFPNPYRIYKSGEFIVSKRFSNVQFYGSYVLSKLD